MIKAVIFDLDDTLIYEKDYVLSGFKHVSNYISDVSGTSENEIFNTLMDLHHDSPVKVFDRLIECLDLKNVSVDDLVQEYRCHSPNIQLIPDAEAILDYLAQEDYILGIISDGYLETQQKKLNALKMSYSFKAIILSDEFGREHWKPDLLPFEKAKEKLQVDYTEMMYIGDNPEKDFYVGSQLPITTVRIYRDSYYKDKEYYQNVKEKYAVQSLVEIKRILCESIENDKTI